MKPRIDLYRGFRRTDDVTARQFDPRNYVTVIGTSEDLGKDHTLAGSVVRVGSQWSVVKTNGPNSFTVWGKITDEAARIEVLDRYAASDAKIID